MSSINQTIGKSGERKEEGILTQSSTKKRYSTSVETKRLSKGIKNVLKNEKTNETISVLPIRDLDGLQESSG